MISIDTNSKYEYEINGEKYEMEFPSVFQLSDYQDKVKDAGPGDTAEETKQLLLKLGMKEIAIKHMNMEVLEQLLGELRKGK